MHWNCMTSAAVSPQHCTCWTAFACMHKKCCGYCSVSVYRVHIIGFICTLLESFEIKGTVCLSLISLLLLFSVKPTQLLLPLKNNRKTKHLNAKLTLIIMALIQASKL